MSDQSANVTTVQVTINGGSYTIGIPDKSYTLLEALRDLGFTGAKYGCGVGRCGACTVVMDGKAVTSCTIMARTAGGAKITTIEGISDGFDLHPLQQAFVEHGAVQCGYCTPGFIMRLYALLNDRPQATEADIAEAIEQNICRCTGYETIVTAAAEAQRVMQDSKDLRPDT